MPFQATVAQALRRRAVPRLDVGFSRWETTTLLRSDAEYDYFLARPRGSELAPNFVLKATRSFLGASLAASAAVERDRFLGAATSPRLLPTVDFVRPRAVSPTRAQRGCVVAPIFSGRTLAERLAAGETFSLETLDAISSQLADALSALHRLGFVAGDLTPNRVLFADESQTTTLVDFAAARRFERPSLLVDFPLDARLDRFDPNYELPPDAFFAPEASPEADFLALRRFIDRLRPATSPRARG
ncbi:MAG: hypothetical protein IKU86_08910 [Thermoguttaceae bacterium]|nr:hypothetical protein [Thermoguttaceae bacterium]